MALSKIDAAIVAIVAVGMLWIEHGHRVVIATPAAAEAAQPAASVCPDTDNVPFSADCIKYIDGGVSPDIHTRMKALLSGSTAPAVAHDRADSDAPACPSSNENAPYSAACIRFMSGWFWQADATEGAPD
jgi:hypothetical protein